MKKILFLLFMIPFMVSCGGSDGDEQSDKEKAIQKQNEVYNLVMKNITGHWIGFQYYNTEDQYIYLPVGWRDISEISWNTEYIFNGDGTGKVIDYTNYDITYSIVKNENYANNPSEECELLCFLKSKNGLSETKSIWIDSEGYLYISYPPYASIKPLISSGGEASIRYKRQ
jgi:hypothetical protein